MEPELQPTPILRTGNLIRFGPIFKQASVIPGKRVGYLFELDVRAAELRKNGHKIRLQEQPFRILLELLEHPGEIILREEIRQKLWRDDTVVEFDKSINAAIKRLRDALNDSADAPRYVETLPRRGYRFIGQVEQIARAQAAGVSASLTALHGEQSASIGNGTRSINISETETTALGPQAITPSQVASVHPRRLLFVGVALAFSLSIATVWYWRHTAPERWVTETALPEINRLTANGRLAESLPIFYRALRILPGDSVLNTKLREISIPVSVVTTPPGANVYIKPYGTPDGEWTSVGRSPIRKFVLPVGFYRWQVTKPGFKSIEAAAGIFDATFEFFLDREGSGPAGMVHIPKGQIRISRPEPAALRDYWIDKYEVTNKAFKEFLNAGGYRTRAYWHEPFLKDGRKLSWEEGMEEFRDSTGRPGPSTWALGDYPSGQDDYPVGGVSWYEALAYAEFAHKQIPTVYHWLHAANDTIWSDILQFSNFDSSGAIRVGSRPSVGPFGTYDLAGNVREWTLNTSGDRRYILGGGWNETVPHYSVRDAMPPSDRSPANGFRCVQYDAKEIPPVAFAPIEQIYRDYRKDKPVSDTAFRIIESFYNYDRTNLHAVSKPEGGKPPLWRKEKITFDAAYRKERVTAYIFLPNSAKPPYQTVIYGPPGSAYISAEISEEQQRGFDFLMKTGRAVLVPIVQGTYGRRSTRGPSDERDVLVEATKDYRRAIDYLAGRADIDQDRLGYFGVSAGAEVGLILMALDNRIRAGVLAEAGLSPKTKPLEVDEINFAPRVHIPILTMNGRNDFFYPVETNQLPMLRSLGASPRDKRHIIFDSGHVLLDKKEVFRETLNWLERYLGKVGG